MQTNMRAATGNGPQTIRATVYGQPMEQGLPPGRVFFFTSVITIIVLNLYASQPLVALIGATFALSPSTAALMPTITLLGYAAGLILLVPLVDILPQRSLVTAIMLILVLALAGIALAPNSAALFAASAALGLAATVVQMLVPIVAGLASDADRGRVVGTVQSGIIVGVLLSRPLASMVSQYADWRLYYAAMALVVAVLAFVLWRDVTPRRPAGGQSYPALVASLLTLLREEPILRWRSAYQFLLMGGFTLFWTAVAFRLAAPPFGLGQLGIAAFAFAGVSGALIAPFAGRLADRGWTDRATILAHLSAVSGFLLVGLAADAGWSLWSSMGHPSLTLGVLLVGAVLLDLGVVADQVLGRIAVNTVRPEARGRMNALYTGIFFLGGGLGAFLAGAAWTVGGWGAVSAAGLLFPIAAIALACGRRLLGGT